MTPPNFDVYLPVALLMGMAVAMVVGALLFGKLLRPNKPSFLKQSAYECGEQPVGVAWSYFNVRFYVVALIFIIFDVESALMFPVAVVYRRFSELGAGASVFFSVLIFIGVLVVGTIYCWSKGDLDWVRSFTISKDNYHQGREQ